LFEPEMLLGRAAKMNTNCAGWLIVKVRADCAVPSLVLTARRPV
jgi:hypothetical protein